MNLTEKIKNSWWVILSFIFFLNGLGFLYIGFKHNNRNWILEGITYEVPWIFYFIIYGIYGLSGPTTQMISFTLVSTLISIIRSVWVAVKLIDVYENNEKYTIKQTNLNHASNNQTNSNHASRNQTNLNHASSNQSKSNNSFSGGCCLCLICIFIIFLVMIL